MNDIVYDLNKANLIRNLKIQIQNFKNGKTYQKLIERIGILTRENERLRRKEQQLEDRLCVLKAKYKKRKTDDEIVEDIVKDFEKLIIENNKLREEIERLKREKSESDKKANESDELAKALRTQLNKNSTNSSIPTSMLDVKNKKKPNEFNSREKTGKSIGGQIGHFHHPRKDLKATNSVIIPMTDDMKNNKNLIDTHKTIRKKVVDIDISFHVTEYVSKIYLDRETNKKIYAPFPKGIKDEINYGPSIKTFILWLSNYCNVSINKIQDLISELSDKKVLPSAGYISNLQSKFVDLSKNELVNIENNLILSDFLHTDITVGNLNGNQINIFNFTNKQKTLYTFAYHKNKEAIKETILGKFSNALIHDHDTSFYSFGDRNKHQECLSHILRYLKAAIEEKPELIWHKQMELFFKELIHKKKDNQFVDYDETIVKYCSILDLGVEEYKANPPNKYEQEGIKLLRRLNKYSKENFLFLKNDLIDYNNNVCERNLRKYKRKQKQAIVFRSQNSIESICSFLSIVETAKLNNQSGYNAIKTIVS